jgi:hypothetical protein
MGSELCEVAYLSLGGKYLFLFLELHQELPPAPAPPGLSFEERVTAGTGYYGLVGKG